MTASASVATEVALREFGPATGSSLYYALLYAPATSRTPLALIESMRALITAIPRQCSNREIAVTKLSWWHAELHRLGTPEARHALTRALGALATEYPDLNTALFQLVNGTVDLLNRGRFESVAERETSYLSIHGPLWRVHASLCGDQDLAVSHCVGQLGAALELTEILRDLRRQIGADIAFISRDREPIPSATMSDAEWYAALAALEAPVLLATLQAARQRLVAVCARPRRLQSIFALTAFAIAHLGEIADDGYRVWERRLELTPLRKWWLAWRARSAI